MYIFNNIDTTRFLNNLHYLWEGMLSIFAVIGVIIISVYLLAAFSKAKRNKNTEA